MLSAMRRCGKAVRLLDPHQLPRSLRYVPGQWYPLQPRITQARCVIYTKLVEVWTCCDLLQFVDERQSLRCVYVIGRTNIRHAEDHPCRGTYQERHAEDTVLG